MQYEVTDEAAIEFARAFYEALADAVPVDAAVSEARKAISRIVSSTLEWGTPVLFMHSPDGVLFNIRQSSAAAAQRHDPAGLAEQSRIASAQPIRRDEADMEPEQSRGMPVQSNMRGVTRMLLAGGALLVLAAVLGMLFMLPGCGNATLRQGFTL